MSAQFTIELKNLRFFAEHGMYPEERKVGNDFEVDAMITYRSPKKMIAGIEETINYVEVYRIIQEVFGKRTHLLESLAMEISDALYHQFPQIRKLSICIRKLNPPITHFSGSVGVTFAKTFKSQ